MDLAAEHSLQTTFTAGDGWHDSPREDDSERRCQTTVKRFITLEGEACRWSQVPERLPDKYPLTDGRTYPQHLQGQHVSRSCAA